MRILGIAGSVRRGSHNRRLIRAAGDSLPSGVELVEWDGLGGLPIFDEDLENDPPAIVQDFLDEIERADALLIATPEYNASVPGGLKNAVGRQRGIQVPLPAPLDIPRRLSMSGEIHLCQVDPLRHRCLFSPGIYIFYTPAFSPPILMATICSTMPSRRRIPARSDTI